jgi:hypothetical protein
LICICDYNIQIFEYYRFFPSLICSPKDLFEKHKYPGLGFVLVSVIKITQHILIDTSGKIVSRRTGENGFELLTKDIEELLKSNSLNKINKSPGR